MQTSEAIEFQRAREANLGVGDGGSLTKTEAAEGSLRENSVDVEGTDKKEVSSSRPGARLTPSPTMTGDRPKGGGRSKSRLIRSDADTFNSKRKRNPYNDRADDAMNRLGGFGDRGKRPLPAFSTQNFQVQKKAMALVNTVSVGGVNTAKEVFSLGKNVRILEDVPFYAAIAFAIMADGLSLIPVIGQGMASLLCVIPIYVLHLFAGAFKDNFTFKILFSAGCYLIDSLIPGLSMFVFYTLGAVVVYVMTLLDRSNQNQ